MLKKVFLSLSVIGVFVLYSFHEQNQISSVQVLPPKSFSGSSTPSPTNQDFPPVESTSTASPTPVPVISNSGYRDGEYIGSVADAFYGPIQVKAIIQNGKISDVQFLQYPNDRGTSVEINTQAMPYLTQEAIQAQSANVDIVTGATDSSEAFRQSLASALSQAKG